MRYQILVVKRERDDATEPEERLLRLKLRKLVHDNPDGKQRWEVVRQALPIATPDDEMKQMSKIYAEACNEEKIIDEGMRPEDEYAAEEVKLALASEHVPDEDKEHISGVQKDEDRQEKATEENLHKQVQAINTVEHYEGMVECPKDEGMGGMDALSGIGRGEKETSGSRMVMQREV